MSLTRYNIVADLAFAVSASHSVEEILSTVAEKSAAAFDVVECAVYGYEPGESVATPLALWSREPSPEDNDYLGVPVQIDADSALHRALHGETLQIRVNDGLLSEVDRRIMERWSEKSTLWVPLSHAGDVIGCLEIIEKRFPRPFTDYDLEFATTIAALAGLAVNEARTRRHLEARTRRLQALLAAAREVASAAGFDDVVDALAKQSGEALEADACYIYSYDEARQATVWVASWERLEETDGDREGGLGTSYPLEDHPCDRRALQTGEPVQEHVSDSALAPSSRADLEKYGLQSTLIVPAIFHGRPLGILEIAQADHERHFSADDLDLAGALGLQAGAALVRWARERARMLEDGGEPESGRAAHEEGAGEPAPEEAPPELDASL